MKDALRYRTICGTVETVGQRSGQEAADQKCGDKYGDPKCGQTYWRSRLAPNTDLKDDHLTLNLLNQLFYLERTDGTGRDELTGGSGGQNNRGVRRREKCLRRIALRSIVVDLKSPRWKCENTEMLFETCHSLCKAYRDLGSE